MTIKKFIFGALVWILGLASAFAIVQPNIMWFTTISSIDPNVYYSMIQNSWTQRKITVNDMVGSVVWWIIGGMTFVGTRDASSGIFPTPTVTWNFRKVNIAWTISWVLYDIWDEMVAYWVNTWVTDAWDFAHLYDRDPYVLLANEWNYFEAHSGIYYTNNPLGYITGSALSGFITGYTETDPIRSAVSWNYIPRLNVDTWFNNMTSDTIIPSEKTVWNVFTWLTTKYLPVRSWDKFYNSRIINNTNWMEIWDSLTQASITMFDNSVMYLSPDSFSTVLSLSSGWNISFWWVITDFWTSTSGFTLRELWIWNITFKTTSGATYFDGKVNIWTPSYTWSTLNLSGTANLYSPSHTVAFNTWIYALEIGVTWANHRWISINMWPTSLWLYIDGTNSTLWQGIYATTQRNVAKFAQAYFSWTTTSAGVEVLRYSPYSYTHYNWPIFEIQDSMVYQNTGPLMNVNAFWNINVFTIGYDGTTTINGDLYLTGWHNVYNNGVAYKNNYTLDFMALNTSLTDGQTIYMGQLPLVPTTTAATRKIFIRNAGTIKMANLYSYATTAGTNEIWTWYIRLNNTTDTVIALVASNSNERTRVNTGLNIAVVPGDYVEIKMVNPTWSTNPNNITFGWYLYIE